MINSLIYQGKNIKNSELLTGFSIDMDYEKKVENNIPEKKTNLQLAKEAADIAFSNQRENKNPFGALAPQGGVNLTPTGMDYGYYYNNSAFDRLGFNPFRDNEAYYRENSTIVDKIIDASNDYNNLARFGLNKLYTGKLKSEKVESIYENYNSISFFTIKYSLVFVIMVFFYIRFLIKK